MRRENILPRKGHRVTWRTREVFLGEAEKDDDLEERQNFTWQKEQKYRDKDKCIPTITPI